MTLRQKFLGIGAAASILAMVLAGLSMVGALKFTALIAETETASEALRNHLTGDMMHDGLRGDVYRALYAAEHTPEAREQVEADMKEHAEAFQGRIAANKELALPAQLREVLSHLDEPLAAYIELAQAIVPAAFEDKARAVAMLPEFNKRFSALEDSMEETAVAIENFVREATDHAHALSDMAEIAMIIALLLAVAMGGGITLYMLRALAAPLGELAGTIRTLADGNTDIPDLDSARSDEIGDMARAVAVFRDNAIEREKLMSESEKEQALRAERQKRIDALIARFRETTAGLISDVAANTDQLETTARTLSAIASQTTSQAGTASAVSSEAATNVQTVAAATEQLSNSITEISRQVNQTKEIVDKASQATVESDSRVASLAEAANKIGEVISLIQEIAEQTNLLALNATIEAARAGEAGKGFAVVASEVKELATQTAKATEAIAEQITAIQGETELAVDAIRGITETMGDVANATVAIAAAVEEQGSSTQEIANNVQQLATGSQDVSENIAGVNKAADETRQSADSVLTVSADVSGNAEKLNRVVEEFLREVAAA
ncbi:MAG: hypothetical protein Kow0032_04550 [Methyloligellaceae bacterium]